MNIEKLDEFFSKKPSKNTLLGKVSYVALGDTFASGQNSKYGFNSNGKLEADKSISGLGYPSFFANLINESENCILENFDNFAMPLSNIEFWTAIIEQDKKKLNQNQRIIDFIQMQDWSVKNPFKNFFSNYFKSWNLQDNIFKVIYQKVKQANLLTISLGFSDLLENIAITKLYAIKKHTDEERQKLLDDNLQEFEQKLANLKSKFQHLMKKITSITNAHIFIVPYVKPFLYLEKVMSEIFVDVDKDNKLSLFDYIFRKFTYMQKQVANELNLNFVNTYDFHYFASNLDLLEENFFSFYLTEKGYKKIALDLYCKLSLNKQNFLLGSEHSNVHYKYKYDMEYWKSDIYSYDQIFEHNISTTKLFEKIYGNTLNQKLLIRNKLENKYSSLLNPYFSISSFIDNYVRYYNYDYSNFLTVFIKEKIPNYYEYESISKILNYLTSEKNTRDLLLLFLKNGKFEKLLFVIQNKLKEYWFEGHKINLYLLKQVIQSVLVSNQKYSYDIFKQIFNSRTLNDNEEVLQDIVLSFLKDCLNTNLLEILTNFKINQNYTKITKYLSELKTFEEFSEFILKSLINRSNLYSHLQDFDIFWKQWLINNKYNLLLVLNKIFLEISSKDKINHTIDFIYETIQSLFKIKNVEGKDERQIKKSLNIILSTLNTNPKNLNNLLINLINKLKNFSIFNFIFKKKTKNIFSIRNWVGMNNFIFLLVKIFSHVLTIRKIVKKYL
ncbi:hypothetical protein NMG95_03160 [Metamycoplasma hyosynoviae]|nr:hypothetical protein [Metamycoplasma hyosynoviae]UTO27213.1 hypothetical protein NMG95_03160 [Metamycoplasma hyosynoviae]